ncbi:MAG TPA: hypothetical protein VFV70_04520 [Hyphomonadaceae bacterium]|nr:hypothetical protein [Hyphomonadaceae bacterium]
MRLAAIALTGLVAAACTTPASKETAAASNEQICKSITLTGTNVPQTMCHTAREWAAIEKKGRRDVEEIDRQLSEANAVFGQ